MNSSDPQLLIRAHEYEIARRQKLIADLQSKAAARDEAQEKFAFLKDLVDDDVIYFKLRFAPNINVYNGESWSKWYNYAALKCNNVWYSTGPKAPKAYTDDQMIQWWMDNDVIDIHIAAEWEIV